MKMKTVIAATVLLSLGGCVHSCTPKFGPGSHLVTLPVKSAFGGNATAAAAAASSSRRFLLEVPAHVDAADGLPALVSIHGYSSNPYYYSLLAGTARYNRDQPFNESDPAAPGSFEYLQAGYGMLVALPFGTADKESAECCPAGATAAQCRGGTLLDKANPCAFNAGGCCGSAVASKRGVDDIAFIKELAEWLVTDMCARRDELFATGFSNGGMMTNRVGCELASTFRAIAPFNGPLRLGGDFKECKPAEPVSVIQFCGSADGACNGGIAATMVTWGEAAGCDVGSTTPTYVSKTTHCQAFDGCAVGTIVEWCMIDGLGHSYSGHLRPGNAGSASKPDFGYQPATNVDGYRYVMNRFSTFFKDRR